MRVLITGGAGFIGSHIAEHFQGTAEVRVLDNLRSGSQANLASMKVEFMQGDVRDRTAVAAAVDGVDYVFHLAAMSSVPESMQKIMECVEVNVQGTVIVLEEAARAGVKKLCFSSSAAVYGGGDGTPRRETMTPAPKSPYAITKLDGEYYCGLFTDSGRLRTVCLRYFNVFGPRQNPGSSYAAAIPIFASNAAAGRPIEIYGDGEQTRDFIYVKDVAAANAFFAMNERTGVYNVGYGGGTSVNSLLCEVLRLTGSGSRVSYLPERAGDIRFSTADVSKLRATGFRTAHTFEDGLRTTVEYFTRGNR